MRFSKLAEGLYGCLFLVLPLSGCILDAGISTSPPPPDLSGSLTVHWTIASTTAPEQCVYYGVDRLELVLYDEAGSPPVTTDAPCEAFDLQVDLPQGVYHADATLVDEAVMSRSLTLPIDNLNVTTGTDLSVDIDFPARSLL